MYRILITGQNSYIGNAVAEYLEEYNLKSGQPRYRVEKLSLRGDSWREKDFSGTDVILHVAGKAHADVGRVSEEARAEYDRVNRQLTAQVAEKAKREGVKQFIYPGSVIVYGESAGVGEKKRITADTRPCPAGFYGDSKLRAEQELRELEAPGFSVAVLRLPMVYGRGCKGNFPALEKLAGRLPVFPDIANERSMLYIENLAEFIRQLIEKQEGGTFFPQNARYVSTARLVALIAEARGRRLRLCSWLNPFVRFLSALPGRGRLTGKTRGLCNKAFGSLTVDMGLSCPEGYSYQKYSLEESIRRIYED